MIREKRIIKYLRKYWCFCLNSPFHWINSCSSFLLFPAICPFALMSLSWTLGYLVVLLKELNCTYNYDIVHVVALYHLVAVELLLALDFLAHYTLRWQVLPYPTKYSILFCWLRTAHYSFSLSLSLLLFSSFLLLSSLPSLPPSFHPSFFLPPLFLSTLKKLVLLSLSWE